MSKNIEIIEIEQFNCYDTKSDVNNNEELPEIQRINCEYLSYENFFDNFMVKNIPVIITSVTDRWECKNWYNSYNKVRFDYLKDQISNIKVPISDCDAKYYNSHEKLEMNFHGYLQYWEELIERDYEVIDKLYYLKDWHLKKDFPSYDFYTTPKYFASDWLNEYLIDTEMDDYMFVYMGPKKTWLVPTPIV